MSRHYHVGQNIPGYLPESDVDIAYSKEEAVAMLIDRKNMLLDDHAMLGEHADRIVVSGNAREDLGYMVDYPDRRYSLGLSIWADVCHDEHEDDEGGWL